MPTPAELGYRMPAEWHRHRATWLTWPKDLETWPDRVPQVEEIFLVWRDRRHHLEENLFNLRHTIGPGFQIFRPGQPGRIMAMPFGRHAITKFGWGGHGLFVRGRFQKSRREWRVEIDAPIAQKRPILASLFHFVEVTRNYKHLFLIG